MNICHVESRGFTSCGMGVGLGPNPVYSPEILFFRRDNSGVCLGIPVSLCICGHSIQGLETCWMVQCRPLHAIGGRES
jgi:hypothetical protein